MTDQTDQAFAVRVYCAVCRTQIDLDDWAEHVACTSKSQDVVEALISALRRTEANFVRAVNSRPVRDMAENLAENRAAIAAALSMGSSPLPTIPSGQEGAYPTPVPPISPIEVLAEAGLAAADPAPFLRAIATLQETQRR